MNKHPSEQQKGQAAEHSRRVPDGYVFDASSGLYKPESYHQESQSEQSSHSKKQHRFFKIEVRRDWATFIISFVTFLVVAYYAYVTSEIWLQAKLAGIRVEEETAIAQLQAVTANNAAKNAKDSFEKTLGQMQQQTGAQQESNRITRESLETVQRAFVYFQTLGATKVFSQNKPRKVTALDFTLTLANNGVTPTKFLRSIQNYWWTPTPMPDNFGFQDFTTGIPGQGNIGPKGTITAGPITIPAEAIEGVKNHTMYLYLWGWARYYDIFPRTKEHVSKFCTEITGFRNDPLKVDSLPTVELVMRNCDRNNCYDEECNHAN